MSFTNVRLILAREVRDQLRDRRTLFMIFVLPVLLYPLLGTAYFEMVQFQTQTSMNVLVVGGTQLAKASTPLIEGDSFSPSLFFDGANGASLLKLEVAADQSSADAEKTDWQKEASRLVQNKSYDAAVIFPPDFAQRLEGYRNAIKNEVDVRSPKVSGTASRTARDPRDPAAEDHLHNGQRALAYGLQPPDRGARPLDGRSRQDESRRRRIA